jgi:hypothetical protein
MQVTTAASKMVGQPNNTSGKSSDQGKNNFEHLSGDFSQPPNHNNEGSNNNNRNDDSNDDEERPHQEGEPNIFDPEVCTITREDAANIFKNSMMVVLEGDANVPFETAYLTARNWVDKGKARTSCVDIQLPKVILRYFNQVRLFFFEHFDPILSHYVNTDAWERKDIEGMRTGIQDIQEKSMPLLENGEIGTSYISCQRPQACRLPHRNRLQYPTNGRCQKNRMNTKNGIQINWIQCQNEWWTSRPQVW